MDTIRYLVMDVDGTLTDGKLYIGQEGELAKAFDIKDGCGILLELPKYNIIPIIITARSSRIVENRCLELHIHEFHQGVKEKLEKLKEVVGENLSQVAYVGDDLPDIPCMEAVKKAGGIVLCPANAIPEVKLISDYVSNIKAGEGAIRDCIYYLCQQQEKKNLRSRIDWVVSLLLEQKYDKEKPAGVLEDGTTYTIQEYYTKEENNCVLETHRKHIDIQYMISGTEMIKLYSNYCLTSAGEYDVMKDVEYWRDGLELSQTTMMPGTMMVIMNNQPHRGAISISSPEFVRKVVCKLEV